MKLVTGNLWLFLPQGRQRQQNLRKRPEVVAVRGGYLKLLDAQFLVAVDSSEAKKQLRVPADSR